MASLKDLVPRVVQYAPGVADAVALLSLQQTANRFASETGAFTETISNVEVPSGSPLVVVQSAGDNNIVHLERVFLEGKEIWARHDLGANQRALNASHLDQPPGLPHSLVLTGHDRFRLIPTPSEDIALDVVAAIAPRPDQDEVPDVMVERWTDALVAGTLNRILRIPMQVFSGDPTPWAVVWHHEILNARMADNFAKHPTGLRVRNYRG